MQQMFWRGGSAWRAPGRWLALLLLVVAPSAPRAGTFVLPTSGCPMAHCDARLSDQARSRVPAGATLVHRDAGPAGSSVGLGCSSNLAIVACSYQGDPLLQSNLVVYDAGGGRIWEDGGRLGPTAWTSAPLIGADGTVVAADRDQVLRADPAAGQVLWRTAKPDPGNPTSPVPIGADGSLLLLATNTGGAGVAALSVYDLADGRLLSQLPLVDAGSGRLYVTRNTPAVRGNRAYVLAAAESDLDDGRLYAVDVCESDACGGRGTLSASWHFAFAGPSGSSPLVIGSRIYFDGRRARGQGRFIAVTDRGASARLLWQRDFASYFGVSPAQDPRGGFWLWPSSAAQTLLRLDADTGATLQQVAIGAAIGRSPAYGAQSALSVYRAANNAPVLVFGAGAPGEPAAPSLLVALDVGSAAAGLALWTFEVAPDTAQNWIAGQFPLVLDPQGRRRIVFNGVKGGTFFVGEP